jgi:hypothetical protein
MILVAAQSLIGLWVAAVAVKMANMHGPATRWLERMLVATAGASGVMFAVGAVLLLQLVVLHVYGTKPQWMARCELLSVDAYVKSPGGLITEARLAFEDDPSPNSTRPAGRNDFGIWRVDYPHAASANAVMFEAKHQCAWWWKAARTQLGPWPIPNGGAD